MAETLSAQMRARLADLKTQRDELQQQSRDAWQQIQERRASSGTSDVQASEKRVFDRLGKQVRAVNAEIQKVRDRIDEISEEEDQQRRAAQARVQNGETGQQRSGWSVGRESSVYRPDVEHSFFRDLTASRRGDWAAAERLHRNNQEAQVERRALGNTGGTGGSGGEFAPPGYLLDEFAAVARAGRVTADRLTRLPLPEGVSSVNIPKFLTGTATAVQTTQNTAAASADPTTAYVSSPITTITGKNVISQQLLDQSGIPLDRIILADLAADYARSLDLQVISGSGSGGQLLGLLNVAGITMVAYTQATPAVAGAGGFYATISKAVSAVATGRFLPPTAILMHPRRWSWVTASFDAQNRPLVAPSGGAVNQVADQTAVAAQGVVGQIAGLPVLTDANLPTNLGASANQDPVLVLRAEDSYLYESDVTMASFDQPYADSLAVLFRVHGYSALVAGRYPASIAVINGTGTVPPVY